VKLGARARDPQGVDDHTGPLALERHAEQRDGPLKAAQRDAVRPVLHPDPGVARARPAPLGGDQLRGLVVQQEREAPATGLLEVVELELARVAAALAVAARLHAHQGALARLERGAEQAEQTRAHRALDAQAGQSLRLAVLEQRVVVVRPGFAGHHEADARIAEPFLQCLTQAACDQVGRGVRVAVEDDACLPALLLDAPQRRVEGVERASARVLQGDGREHGRRVLALGTMGRDQRAKARQAREKQGERERPARHRPQSTTVLGSH
jgi:hypothetical protein